MHVEPQSDRRHDLQPVRQVEGGRTEFEAFARVLGQQQDMLGVAVAGIGGRGIGLQRQTRPHVIGQGVRRRRTVAGAILLAVLPGTLYKITGTGEASATALKC